MIVAKRDLLDSLGLAAAAYDLRKLPAGYSAPVPIIADTKASSALFNAKQRAFGFVTSRDGVTYIVFRGTQNIEEWADDACALLVDHWSKGRVHKGFRDVYAALRVSVASAKISGPVTVIGHSLGGALATLCAIEMPGCDMVTFAGPRVGDEAFADYAQASTRTHLRVVNARDIVCHVPMRPLYSHAGGTVTFAGRSLDWHAAHNLAVSYGPAIEGMQDQIETQVNQR
jgi:pimeloyl-ACP methyl ester carboxylesterase